MTSRSFSKAIALSAIIALTSAIPSFAAASPISVKVGYFNLQLVKASFPEAAGSETLREQAQNQLRRDVEEGNKMLQKLQEDKKPKEDIEKSARQLQTEINAKQQALIQLVQTQLAIANQTIASAVASVAKDKGLDLVIDVNGVFAGGEKVVSNGEDITDAIVKKLNPGTAIKSGGGGGESKPAPAAAGGK